MNGTSPGPRVWQSLRQGEVLGLKWAHVDLDQGLLRIRSTRTPKTSRLLHPRSQPTRHRAFTLRCSESDALPLLNKCRSGPLSSISPAATNRPILNEATLSW
jgi:integrase